MYFHFQITFSTDEIMILRVARIYKAKSFFNEANDLNLIHNYINPELLWYHFKGSEYVLTRRAAENELFEQISSLTPYMLRCDLAGLDTTLTNLLSKSVSCNSASG